jgi:galactitol-specific phosphotransferase system IIB component
MKLKRIFCGVLCATATMIGMSVMASASENSIKVGQPINVATGEVADSFKANDLIAVPVDIDSTTGCLTAYGVVVGYNTDYISPQIDSNNIDDDVFDSLDSLGSLVEKTVGSGVYGAVNCLKAKRGSTYYGTLSYNPTFDGISDEFGFNWFHSAPVDVNSSAPEAYILFTVKKDIDASALNIAVAKRVESNQIYVQDYAESVEGHELPVTFIDETSEAVANACAGAVQLNIDTANLSKWVQHLYVSIDGGAQKSVDELVNNEDGTYSLPVRIISSNTGSHTVAFYADLADTKDGAAKNVKVGETTVTLDSPTSYTAVDYAN